MCIKEQIFTGLYYVPGLGPNARDIMDINSRQSHNQAITTKLNAGSRYSIVHIKSGTPNLSLEIRGFF